MKRSLLRSLAIALVVVVSSVGCSKIKPNYGEEAVLVMKPWFFGHGGVDETPVKTGLNWAAYTTDHVIVNMQPIQIEEKYADLMCRDGVPLSFDTFSRYQVLDSVKLIRDWGPDWYKNNVQAEFGNRVRQCR